jgi:hypothetical protein
MTKRCQRVTKVAASGGCSGADAKHGNIKVQGWCPTNLLSATSRISPPFAMYCLPAGSGHTTIVVGKYISRTSVTTASSKCTSENNHGHAFSAPQRLQRSTGCCQLLHTHCLVLSSNVNSLFQALAGS